MKVKDLICGLEILEVRGDLEKEIKGISYDSRKIKKDELFVALRGSCLDGHNFIKDALQKGVAALVVESIPDEDLCVPIIKVKDSRRALSQLAINFFNPPLDKINVVGITGTNGKTTTSYLIESILKSAGKKVGVIGTVSYRFCGKELKANVTTPESLELMQMLKEMSNTGTNYVVMEVSSHSLSQGRVRDCPFKVAVFTNITRDHLDYHGSMREYFDAKKKLFLEYNPAFCVINQDDPFGRLLIDEIKKTKNNTIITYGIENGIIRAKDVQIDKNGIKAEILLPKNKCITIHSALVGKFNLYNILASVAVSYCLEIEESSIQEGISKLKTVPGRMELIKDDSSPFVIVDYAHTPDALFKVLSTVRAVFDKRIITVFGCGGNRDKGKREEMGRIAALYSDFVVITSDNPRFEDPFSIMKQIERGVKQINSSDYVMEVKREEAIKKAIKMAQKEDVVLIAGKGHEDYQIIGDKKIPFDDRQVVKQILKETRTIC